MQYTSNGKIDKRALANQSDPWSAPISCRATRVSDHVPYLFAGAESVQEEIGATDSFFHLGGHSLQAAQIVLLAKHEGFRAEYGRVSDHPTVRAIWYSAAIQTAATCLSLSFRKGSLPCTPAGSGSPARTRFAATAITAKACTLPEPCCSPARTGFLSGIHVPYELLNTGYNKIYCMVRPQNNLTRRKSVSAGLAFLLFRKQLCLKPLASPPDLRWTAT